MYSAARSETYNLSYSYHTISKPCTLVNDLARMPLMVMNEIPLSSQCGVTRHKQVRASRASQHSRPLKTQFETGPLVQKEPNNPYTFLKHSNTHAFQE